jgi:hypothetical protein
MSEERNEPVLPEDYPMYAGYLYVADGKVIAADFHGITVREYKGRTGAKEVRRCDITARKLWA